MYTQRVNVIWQPENFDSDLVILFHGPDRVQHPVEGCRGNIPCALCARGDGAAG